VRLWGVGATVPHGVPHRGGGGGSTPVVVMIGGGPGDSHHTARGTTPDDGRAAAAGGKLGEGVALNHVGGDEVGTVLTGVVPFVEGGGLRLNHLPARGARATCRSGGSRYKTR
jgi:hypothetical protein